MKGNISLGRIKSNVEDDYIGIQIQDQSSGVNFLQVKINLLEFAKLITGLSNVDCDFELRFTDTVGKVRQHKEEILPINFYQDGEEEIEAVLTRYEVDGWKAYRKDIKNHHRYTPEGQRVSFIRFVDETTT